MDKNKLTVIACAGSILAGTLFTDPSHGMPIQNYGDTSGQTGDEVSLPANRVNTPRSTEDAISPLSYERRLQQTAQTKYGCGCTNCVSAVRKLVLSGELSV